MAPPKTFLFLSLLSFLLTSPSSATAGNILLSGGILPTGSHLSTRNAVFGIHHDCNLALIYNHNLRFQSNTRLRGTNCTLTLTDNGQLILQTAGGSTVWSSSPPGKTGHYAALLRPDGHVAVYGPSIWTTTPSLAAARRSTNGAADLSSNSANSRNLMFSSQVLDDSSKLASGDHVLSMTDDCNFELAKETEGVVWESGTKGMGRNCFARLDHRGQIAIVDSRFKVVWASKGGEAVGVYILAVQNDGKAAVYGPAMWSTAY